MKSMKVLFSAALIFGMGLGFAATVSAKVNTGCFSHCMEMIDDAGMCVEYCSAG